MKWLLIITLFLAACSPVKRVLRSPEKTLAVVTAYFKHQPVIPSDTAYKYLPGTTTVDTLIEYGYLIDSVPVTKDSIITRYITKRITDTLVKTVIDRSLLNEYQKQNIAFQVTIEQLKEDESKALENGRIWKVRFWILAGIILLVLTLFGINLFKKKL